MKNLFKALFVVVLAAVLRPAYAVPLQSLFDGGFLVVEDKVFLDWRLIDFVVSDPLSDPDLGLIDVIPLPQPLNPGLRFVSNGELTVTNQNFLDLHFGFTVVVLNPAHLIKDNTLELVQFAFGGVGGVITIIETVFDPAGNELADKFVEADNRLGNFRLFDKAEFLPQQVIDVEKNILIAGDFVGDVVRLDVFEQRFSEVPEPRTLVLLGIGLLSFLLFPILPHSRSSS